MAASPLSPDDDVFERLKNSSHPDVLKQREEAVRERVAAQYDRAQRRLGELVQDNSTLPVTIKDIKVFGAQHTRAGFLERVLAPALSAEKNSTYTLASAISELQATANKLNRFGIFRQIHIDLDSASPPGVTPLSLTARLTVRERSRFTLHTGAEVGNTEGTTHLHAQIRNIFGGAESLFASATKGTRTRAAYELTFASPILTNPDTIFELGGFASTRSKHYSSHEEALKGLRTAVRFPSKAGEHELAYTGAWRQTTSLAADASPGIRAEAGDSVKSSLIHTFTRERRDNALLPGRGYFLRSSAELAGAGVLGGDVHFGKMEAEAQAALPLPLGCALTFGLRGGLLSPLPSALLPDDEKNGTSSSNFSRVNDRFVLGGPNDVRGFREAGIGPRDGKDALGADVYAAFGASFLAPLPRIGRDTPLRLQAFVNGGRAVAAGPGNEEDGVLGAVKEVVNGGLPSTAVGLGLVYAHPLARFELNFCLPVVKREGEAARKGLQFGVGIRFL